MEVNTVSKVNLSEVVPPTIIKASAGTGKTFQLTKRYIQLLLSGVPPESIVATTFTRKAAAEIKARIFSRIAAAALSTQGAKHLSEELEIPSLSQSQAQELLANVIASQHRLKICTLDSLFISIAKCFSLELGLSVDWGIADEALLNSIRIKSIANLIKEDEENLYSILHLLNRGNSSRSVINKLNYTISRIHASFEDTPAEAWYGLKIGEGLESESLDALLQRLEDAEMARNKKNEERKRWVSSRDHSLASARHGDWKSLLSKGFADAILKGKPDFDGAEITSELLEIFKPLILQAATILLGELQQQTATTAELLTAYDQTLRSDLRRENILRFNDVRSRLSNASLTEQAAELYYRLDSKISHLLLDEFQDTSGAEWHIIEPLVDEIMSQWGLERSFFCVGDVKQAIYGWRGGVAEIFDSLSERYEDLQATPMDKSWRSSPTIIEFVNNIFSSISTNEALIDYPAAKEQWQANYNSHTTARSDLEGYVTIECAETEDAIADRYLEDEDEPDITCSPAILRAIECCKELRTKHSSASIGVLVRKNASVAQIIQHLQNEGVPASEEGGNPLTDSLAVNLLLSMLRFADHPGDRVAGIQLQRSPLAKKISYLRNLKGENALTASRSLREEIAAKGLGKMLLDMSELLFEHCSTREQRRLRQLVEIAYNYSKTPSSSPGLRTSDFINYIRDKRVDDRASANVRVMTIHQSKGLEFDIVILPELAFPLQSVSRDPLLTYRESPTEPPKIVSRNASESIRRLSPFLQEMYNQASNAQVKESLSLLYVALTRSVHALHIILPAPKKNEKKLPSSFAGIIRSALVGAEAPEPGSTIFETGTPGWKTLKQGAPANATAANATTAKPRAKVLQNTSGAKTRGLQRITPSELEGSETKNLSSTLQVGSSAAKQRGALIHSLFEKVEWLETSDTSEEFLKQEILKYCYDSQLVDSSLSLFKKYLQAKPIVELLSKSSLKTTGTQSAEVFNEFPFVVREADSLLSGKIDRLVVTKEAGKIISAEIIDYKTDLISADSPHRLEDKVIYYRPQIEAYGEVISKFSGLPKDSLKTKLVFLSEGVVVPL